MTIWTILGIVLVLALIIGVGLYSGRKVKDAKDFLTGGGKAGQPAICQQKQGQQSKAPPSAHPEAAKKRQQRKRKRLLVSGIRKQRTAVFPSMMHPLTSSYLREQKTDWP